MANKNNFSISDIVLCTPARTPIGHIGKSLSDILPEELLTTVIKAIQKKAAVPPAQISGVIGAWVGQGSHAPNIARVAALRAGLNYESQAYTIQANCVSSIEAICSAVRQILNNEGDLYIAGGTESMSNFPYPIRGSRNLKELRSLETLKQNWPTLWDNPAITIVDCIEEGLIDPYRGINMAATAEICAQWLGISREDQDEYAYESYRRALEGEENGFYADYLVPVKNRQGETKLEKDEYPYLRANLLKKKEMFKKAPLLFDNPLFSIARFYEQFGQYIPNSSYLPGKSQATLTLFNSCARSDGAAAMIVTSEKKARELGLDISARVKDWVFVGNDPVYMGIGPVYAVEKLLQKTGLAFREIDYIELHEAFAATCRSIFKKGKEEFAQEWEEKWQNRQVNPYGGSIALGHPLAATGARVIISILAALKRNPDSRYGLATACAGGGFAAAFLVERYNG